MSVDSTSQSRGDQEVKVQKIWLELPTHLVEATTVSRREQRTGAHRSEDLRGCFRHHTSNLICRLFTLLLTTLRRPARPIRSSRLPEVARSGVARYRNQ